MRDRMKISLQSQIVFKLKDRRLIAQTSCKFSQACANKRIWPGVRNNLKTRCETDALRFALFSFGDRAGDLTRGTRARRVAYWRRTAGSTFRLTQRKLC